MTTEYNVNGVWQKESPNEVKVEHCCDEYAKHCTSDSYERAYTGDHHPIMNSDGERNIFYSGGDSVSIKFCPFCGKKF